MKNINITLHPLSLLVGAALIMVIGLTVSAALPAGGPAGRDAQLVSVDGQPAARDMVIIREGTPYTVPSGKLVVVHSLGRTNDETSTCHTTIYIDGAASGSRRTGHSNNSYAIEWTSLGELPGGVPATENSIVTVTSNTGGYGMAVGSLHDV
jgi:hypothetical protein